MTDGKVSNNYTNRETAMLRYELVMSELCRLKSSLLIEEYKERVLEEAFTEDHGIFEALAFFVKFAALLKAGKPYMHIGKACYMRDRMADTVSACGGRIENEGFRFIYLSYVGRSYDDYIKKSGLKINKKTSAEEIKEKIKKAEFLIEELKKEADDKREGFFTELWRKCMPVITEFSELLTEESFKNKSADECETVIASLSEKIIESFSECGIEFIFYSEETEEFFDKEKDVWEKNAVYHKSSGKLLRRGIAEII